MTEPAAAVFPSGPPDEEADSQTAGTVPAPPGQIDWRQGARSSALAGLLLALAIFFAPVIVAGMGLVLRLGQLAIGLLILLANFGCMLVAGALAVQFYRRRLPQTGVSSGMGVRLGAASGLLGFLLYAVPQALRLAFSHLGGAFREGLRKAIEQSAAQNPDPKAQEVMRNLLTPGILAAILTFLLVVFFLLFLVFSGIGGAIGASIWGRKQSS